MATYKTPGVYVEEISTLPPSVAEVSTAIPAFIGYTAKAPGDDTQNGPTVARINTLLEYEDLFGKVKPSSFLVSTHFDTDRQVSVIDKVSHSNNSIAKPEFLMYYCMSLYFKNGGGSCYIISIGDYNATPEKAHFEAGLASLEKEDEPTLILLTDAVNLNSGDYYAICQKAIAQCKKLGDRFAILDVLGGKNKVAEFRNQIGTSNLMYAAAYYPYLQTSLSYHYTEDDIQIKTAAAETPSLPNWEKTFGENGIIVRYSGTSEAPQVKIIAGTAADALEFVIENDLLTLRNVSGKDGAGVSSAWEAWKAENVPRGFEITPNGDGSGDVPHTSNSSVDLERQAAAETSSILKEIKSTETAVYNLIKTAMAVERVVLPPSAAVAGVYARVDRERGVWKAPANVSLSSVIVPVSKITHDEQAGLNVDPTAGKSINAIREFTGKGTLIWGARTLAGNDNEWRYVSVRRLFNMIKESTKKATSFAVFEPNDATTWLKVKGMIEAYLYGLWERGALAGPTPEAACFVNVGLGKTMTSQDVLEGRLIVEIGVAAVRPAEFIIIRFTHKLQEA